MERDKQDVQSITSEKTQSANVIRGTDRSNTVSKLFGFGKVSKFGSFFVNIQPCHVPSIEICVGSVNIQLDA